MRRDYARVVSPELLRYRTPYLGGTLTVLTHGRCCLRGAISTRADILVGRGRSIKAAWTCLRKYSYPRRNRPNAEFPLKTRQLRAHRYVRCQTLSGRPSAGVNSFSGSALVQQDDARLPKHAMFEWFATRGVEEAVCPSKQWQDRLQENLHALRTVPCKGNDGSGSSTS